MIGKLSSTAQEIEDAIRSLPASERAKLLEHLPEIFPEFSGDLGWGKIIADQRPHPRLSETLDRAAWIDASRRLT